MRSDKSPNENHLYRIEVFKARAKRDSAALLKCRSESIWTTYLLFASLSSLIILLGLLKIPIMTKIEGTLFIVLDKEKISNKSELPSLRTIFQNGGSVTKKWPKCRMQAVFSLAREISNNARVGQLIHLKLTSQPHGLPASAQGKIVKIVKPAISPIYSKSTPDNIGGAEIHIEINGTYASNLYGTTLPIQAYIERERIGIIHWLLIRKIHE